MAHDEPTAQLAQNLANNLRHLRERRGLTQANLGKLCGVPRSTLANLEVGGGNPTLAVLGRLSSALQVTLEELLSRPRGLGRVYPRGSLPVLNRAGVVAMQLLPDPIRGMEIQRMELTPGARHRGVPHRPGTREYLYCERGSLTLWVAGERFDLQTGDVCAFQGDRKHSYVNDGDQIVVSFSVVTLAPLEG
ncbi:MAG: transcriptional regulator with XRE-family HTH domain [Kiritimatiellia bacterium]|jgi:transcriptional regulator with XRE-family HTH domain